MKIPISDLITTLQSENIDDRLKAIEKMGEVTDDQIIPHLINSLGDHEWRVRKSAIAAITHQPRTEAFIEQLISVFYLEGQIGKKNSALEALVGLGALPLGSIYSHIPKANSDVKKFLVEVMGEIGHHQSTSHLVELLKDEDENVRLAVIEALGKVGDTAAVGSLLDMMAENNAVIQFAVIKTLKQIGDSSASEKVASMARIPGLERVCLETLGKIGDLQCVDLLIGFFESGPIKMRTTAAISLAQVYRRQSGDSADRIRSRVQSSYSPGVGRFLGDVLKSEDTNAHWAAISILSWIGEKDFCKDLIFHLKGPFREETIEALKSIGLNGLQDLIGGLQSEQDSIRQGICVVLGEIGDEEAIQPLIQLLGDSNGHVRESAAKALGKIGDPTSARFIFELLKDSYSSVQESAVAVLSKFNSPDLITRLLDLAENEDGRLRMHAIRTLGMMKAEVAVPKIVFSTKDEEADVRKAAIEALGNFEGEEIDSKIVLGFADDNQDVRMMTLSVISHRDSINLLNHIEPLLEDSNIWLRAAACRALGKEGSPSAKEILKKMLFDHVGVVRIAAIESLIPYQDSNLSSLFFELTKTSDVEVVKVAIHALAHLGGKHYSTEIQALLNHTDWGIRAAAATASGTLEAPSVRKKLQKMMKEDSNSVVRQSAEYALAQLPED